MLYILYQHQANEKLLIVFAALNTKNLPFIFENTSSSRDDSVDNRLAALDMQMKEMLTNPVTICRNATPPLPQTYSSSLKTGIKNNSEHVPHQLLQPSLQPSPPTDVQHDNTIHSVDNTGWEVKTSRSRRSKAVYHTKKSEGLRALRRGYDCVVFNVTTKDTADVRTWMSNSGVEVMDIELLSKDDSERPTHMFRVKVHYKHKDTVLNSGFWPECVGCRNYFYKKKIDTNKKPGEQTNTDNHG